MYTDITGYVSHNQNNLDLILFDFSFIRQEKYIDVSRDVDSSLIILNRFSSLLEPENQNDLNIIISAIFGVLAASACISWYNAAGGLVYYGVSTFVSMSVGALIWLGVAVLIGYGVYVILDEIFDEGDYNESYE
ncbi:MAG: hypothetical protein WC296_02875 [Candidatus Izemoplasmatales bacterium]|jgi:hypothetical protein